MMSIPNKLATARWVKEYRGGRLSDDNLKRIWEAGIVQSERELKNLGSGAVHKADLVLHKDLGLAVRKTLDNNIIDEDYIKHYFKKEMPSFDELGKIQRELGHSGGFVRYFGRDPKKPISYWQYIPGKNIGELRGEMLGVAHIAKPKDLGDVYKIWKAYHQKPPLSRAAKKIVSKMKKRGYRIGDIRWGNVVDNKIIDFSLLGEKENILGKREIILPDGGAAIFKRNFSFNENFVKRLFNKPDPGKYFREREYSLIGPNVEKGIGFRTPDDVGAIGKSFKTKFMIGMPLAIGGIVLAKYLYNKYRKEGKDAGKKEGR